MSRKYLPIAALGAISLAMIMMRAPTAAQAQGNGGESELQRGLEIAPVPLNLAKKNRSLVGRGSYLVNGPADCTGCHTNGLYLPGGNPFMGQPAIINTAIYLGGGASFGPFVSRNLTPDSQGRPAGLTLSEFKQVLRTGVDLKGVEQPPVPAPTPLLQVMPWPAHRYSTDKDLESIYEYLSAIPCLEGGPGAAPNRCLQ
jgi:hypothetical protein